MFGLIIIVIGVAYLLLSIAVVKGARRHARNNSKSVARWGWGAALVMYLIPFWDWLPTVATHQYYCATEAGFWVYKTPEQWKKENPGVMETLVSYNRNPGGFNVDWPSQHDQGDDGHILKNINHINERFNYAVVQQDMLYALPITRKENVLWDTKNDEVIARYVDFGTGNSVKNTVGPPGPLKFWLHNGSCNGGKDRQTKFGVFYMAFKGTEK